MITRDPSLDIQPGPGQFQLPSLDYAYDHVPGDPLNGVTPLENWSNIDECHNPVNATLVGQNTWIGFNTENVAHFPPNHGHNQGLYTPIYEEETVEEEVSKCVSCPAKKDLSLALA